MECTLVYLVLSWVVQCIHECSENLVSVGFRRLSVAFQATGFQPVVVDFYLPDNEGYDSTETGNDNHLHDALAIDLLAKLGYTDATASQKSEGISEEDIQCLCVRG